MVQQRLVSATSGDNPFVHILPGKVPLLHLHHPVNDIHVRVYSERSYGQGSNQLYSISFDQRPDVSIEISAPGEPLRLILVDPKYKLDSELLGGERGVLESELDAMLEGQLPKLAVLPMMPLAPAQSGRPKKVDIDKMHAYRDAIRNSDGYRAVVYAAIMYPGETVRFGNELAALRALPGKVAGSIEEVATMLRSCLLG